MTVNKNFVVKNGIEVATNLIYGNQTEGKVGIGTTIFTSNTLSVNGGIGATAINSQYLNVSGIATITSTLNVGAGGSILTASNTNKFVGVGTTNPQYVLDVRSPVSTGQTALYVYGDLNVTGDINLDDISLDSANISTLTVTGITSTNNLLVSGISTFQSGLQVTSGITTLGVTTATSTTLENLNVSGITTLGVTTATNVTNQNLNVSGITTLGVTTATSTTLQNLTVSGITTLGVTSATSTTLQNLNVSGVTTTSIITSQNLNVSGVTTLGVTTATLASLQNLNVSGVTTLGVTSATSTTLENLNVSGITTLGVTTATNVTNQNLNVSGITTISGVTISAGVVTAGPGVTTVYFYGDGSNLINTPPGFPSPPENAVQYRSSSAFAGSTSFTFDGSTVNIANTANIGIASVGFLTATNANIGFATIGVMTATNVYASGYSVFLDNVSHGGSIFGVSASFSGIVTAVGGFSGSLTGTASTASFASTAYGLTGSPNITVTNLNSTGISTVGFITATNLYAGVATAGLLNATNSYISGISSVGTAITMYGSSGIVSATKYYGDGSSLSGIDATRIINGTSNVTVASGSTISATVAGQNIFNVTGAGVSMVAGKTFDVSSYSETVQTLGSSGSPISGTNQLDINTYTTFIAYVGTSSVTFTLPSINSGRLYSWTLILIYTNSGSRSVSFSFGTLRYPGGSSSVTLSSTAVHDVLSFFTADGATNTYASVVGLGFAV